MTASEQGGFFRSFARRLASGRIVSAAAFHGFAGSLLLSINELFDAFLVFLSLTSRRLTRRNTFADMDAPAILVIDRDVRALLRDALDSRRRIEAAIEMHRSDIGILGI